MKEMLTFLALKIFLVLLHSGKDGLQFGIGFFCQFVENPVFQSPDAEFELHCS